MQRNRQIELITALGLLISVTLPGQGLRLTVRVPDHPNADIILAHRLGHKFFTDDTVKTTPEGEAVFEKAEPMPEGMYQIVFPDKKFSEFFLEAGQVFTLQTKAAAPSENLVFTGSPVNARFLEWQTQITANRNRTSQIQTLLKKPDLSPDSTTLLNAEFRKIQAESNHLWDSALKDLAGTLPGSFIRGLKPVRMPDSLSKASTREAQMRQYYYVRNHFFDGVDFGDERLLRTPLLETKMEQYFKQVLPQLPDSLCQEADRVIARTKPGDKVYQFVVQYLLNLYSEPEIMGTDAVYVHIAENYYMTGKAPWIDSTNLQGIRTRVKDLKPLLIGSVPPPLSGLIDPDGKTVEIKDIKSDYLILYFWSPDCGFCKESTPKLHKQYDLLKQLGVEIIALNTRTDKTTWTRFITDHNLNWINVYSPDRVQYMMEDYSAFSTPAIFILDNQRRIIAKSIGIDQIKPFLEHHIANRKKVN